MVETFIFVLLGLAAGLVLGFILGKNQVKMLLGATQRENANLQKQMEQSREEARQQQKEKTEEMENFSRRSLESMQNTFRDLANQVLEAKTEKLQSDSNERLDLMLKPLKDNISQLGKAVQDNNEKAVHNHSVFQETIRQLTEQTQNIGKEADNLARALKSDSKMQGDWGEMVLTNILQKSGLEEGREFYTQENYKTAEGQNVRPDVVVKFPDEHTIVIDSKVSLTAFSDYVNAETKPEREEALKRHVDSVKKHIQELSQQNYPKDVYGSAEYVIMFMPSEASYVAAVQADEKLNSWAWEKKIVIACPNILIMTLQIVNNVWKTDRQDKNLRKIVGQANDLYDKFVTFVEVFEKVGKGIDGVQKDYEVARKRLVDGRGNLVNRLEDLKRLGGLIPKKELDDKIKEEAGE